MIDKNIDFPNTASLLFKGLVLLQSSQSQVYLSVYWRVILVKYFISKHCSCSCEPASVRSNTILQLSLIPPPTNSCLSLSCSSLKHSKHVIVAHNTSQSWNSISALQSASVHTVALRSHSRTCTVHGHLMRLNFFSSLHHLFLTLLPQPRVCCFMSALTLPQLILLYHPFYFYHAVSHLSFHSLPRPLLYRQITDYQITAFPCLYGNKKTAFSGYRPHFDGNSGPS